ncbi:hypothetical protein ACHAWU_004216 [Discostella pseudostelligera]|uniref:Uncharacterized protein n=1 Tax=Discostella pseudostelligera TaxID=259834 RepID=A0ABD3M257_9STRA
MLMLSRLVLGRARLGGGRRQRALGVIWERQDHAAVLFFRLVLLGYFALLVIIMVEFIFMSSNIFMSQISLLSTTGEI